MDIFEAVDPHMGKTPLHFAVLCQNPMNSKIMLTCGIDIEARDNRGYTALHMAAKKGYELNCKMLLEYGANPNVHGNKPKYYQTPLQQATTQKVVQNLLKYGADPNANMMKSNDKDEHFTCSTIDVFLERHPEAIEDFLNECISTNGQELDSDELQIIFNFELFFKEGFPRDDENCTSGTINEVLNNVDELAFHKKVIEDNASQLLEHPVAAAYLYFLWHLIRRVIYTYVGIYVIFLINLIFLVFLQEEYLMRCDLLLLHSNFTCGNHGRYSIDTFEQFSELFYLFKVGTPSNSRTCRFRYSKHVIKNKSFSLSEMLYSMYL